MLATALLPASLLVSGLSSLSASSACISDRIGMEGSGFAPLLRAILLCSGQSRSYSGRAAPLVPNVRLATCITTACFDMFYVWHRYGCPVPTVSGSVEQCCGGCSMVRITGKLLARYTVQRQHP